MELSSKERFARILNHQPVDRVGLFEVYWRETVEKWVAEGRFARPEMVSDHFGLDVRRTGGEITPADYAVVNLVADVDYGKQVVEETETTQLLRDGNGALLRWIKAAPARPSTWTLRFGTARAGRAHIRPYPARRNDLRAAHQLCQLPGTAREVHPGSPLYDQRRGGSLRSDVADVRPPKFAHRHG